ncbi:MAG: acyl-ACP--UDP-N-acetylglucosamine O-acyltransferase [Bdellovibrionota bacterium]
MSDIHPTALVDSRAEIGTGTKIGPYSVIGSRVKLGANCLIKSHVVIEGNTQIGDGNTIFQFASIGAIPQDLKYKGEDSILEIGDKNIIREYVTLQPGTEGGGMITKIGHGNLFMASAHVGHDTIIGDHNIFANLATLAGHVIIGDYTTLGGLSGVHQFTKVGSHAFVGGGSVVTSDVPPYCMAQGNRVKLIGINSIGLQRRGFSEEDISIIKKVYRKLIFSKKGTLAERKARALEEAGDSRAAMLLIDFVENSERGIADIRSKNS